MVDQRLLNTLDSDGIVVIPSVLPLAQVAILRTELELSIAEDNITHTDVFDKGMVHNCMVRGKNMASLLDNEILITYLDAAFSSTCIVYAYQSSSLMPGQGNYGSRVHVDSPRFIPGYATNMGVIFPLDDFTEENGATFFLKGSHKNAEIPSDSVFAANASRAHCSAGDMILFNGRLVHAAGANTTDRARHSLTINVCRSFMRQRFDFPRLMSVDAVNNLGANGKRMIGMNVRVPTSLSEFYLPSDQRLYKSNQG